MTSNSSTKWLGQSISGITRSDSPEYSPGHKDGKTVWLPVDSKFPKEPFELLMEAYEQGDAEQIERHRLSFARGIKKCASDISSKYIDSPNTTDFAISFFHLKAYMRKFYGPQAYSKHFKENVEQL